MPPPIPLQSEALPIVRQAAKQPVLPESTFLRVLRLIHTYLQDISQAAPPPWFWVTLYNKAFPMLYQGPALLYRAKNSVLYARQFLRKSCPLSSPPLLVLRTSWAKYDHSIRQRTQALYMIAIGVSSNFSPSQPSHPSSSILHIHQPSHPSSNSLHRLEQSFTMVLVIERARVDSAIAG
ncbi:hypothetical protein FB451DRAFT_1389642 [Mycena latifolia]|nr:hypothetical protein FB451DRAFT_1389642 [Mycena latifolia]